MKKIKWGRPEVIRIGQTDVDSGRRAWVSKDGRFRIESRKYMAPSTHVSYTLHDTVTSREWEDDLLSDVKDFAEYLMEAK